jgi:hypothetical protein
LPNIESHFPYRHQINVKAYCRQFYLANKED